uniref:F5/8 type C domain-containing protein n=1 Tax=Corethron hystrix TaxID=216773 RepID=A0A7S1BBA2_9STRA|mmetsp:Transcript_20469/g.46470  ORF Transcript_20469/g.46470 Transcript_20469/m.46470 type:complete len:252 (+) Transcript_20469:105-860(+)
MQSRFKLGFRTVSILLFIKIFLSFVCFVWLDLAFNVFLYPMQAQNLGQGHTLRNKNIVKVESPQRNTPNSPNSKKPKIISRNPSVRVTSDVRGNLGPASVIIQDPPGKDWIKDRWQAAGDMHGTAIPGQHWVILDFGSNNPRSITKVVVDWEAAYSNDYRIEISDGLETEKSSPEWCVLYNTQNKSQSTRRRVEEYGQSPGVKTKTPLHVVHTINIDGMQVNCSSFRFLRVFIRKSAMGWGVSIWELDVYG